MRIRFGVTLGQAVFSKKCMSLHMTWRTVFVALVIERIRFPPNLQKTSNELGHYIQTLASRLVSDAAGRVQLGYSCVLF